MIRAVICGADGKAYVADIGLAAIFELIGNFLLRFELIGNFLLRPIPRCDNRIYVAFAVPTLSDPQANCPPLNVAGTLLMSAPVYGPIALFKIESGRAHSMNNDEVGWTMDKLTKYSAMVQEAQQITSKVLRR